MTTQHLPALFVRFFGGFIFLEEQASFSCEGATTAGNNAGEQGGAIYAREAKWVSSAAAMGNGTPVGATAYLTNIVQAANFVYHAIIHSSRGGGNVLYAAETSILHKRWTFGQMPASGDLTSYRRGMHVSGLKGVMLWSTAPIPRMARLC